jgi:hypothetical protein
MVSTAIRRAAAKKLRANTTPPERLLWRALKELPMEGTHFRRQAPIGPYVVDFFCPGQGVSSLNLMADIQRGRDRRARQQEAGLAGAARLSRYPLLEFGRY